MQKAPAYIGLLMLTLILSLLAKDFSIATLGLPLLAIVFLSALLQPREPAQITAERSVTPQTLNSLEPVKVTLTIVNHSPNRWQTMEVTDQLDRELNLRSGSNRIVLRLSPKSSATIHYQVIPSSRGSFQIGPVRVLRADPLKLFPVGLTLGIADSLYVYPEKHLVRIQTNPRRTGTWWGSTPSKRSGMGMEFYGLRDYQQGDELRDVNWKATARLGKIVTNEFEAERASDTVLILDAGKLSGTRIDSKSILDYETEAAQAISSNLLNNGNRVGLILHGKFRHWLYPGFGTRQYLKLREQLMLAREGDSEIPLRFLAAQLAPMILAPGSQVIILGHPFSMDLPEAVTSLQSLGYSVMVLIVQPYRGKQDLDSPSSLAARIVLIQTEEKMIEVQRLCATAHWRVDESLDKALRGLNFWLKRKVPAE